MFVISRVVSQEFLAKANSQGHGNLAGCPACAGIVRCASVFLAIALITLSAQTKITQTHVQTGSARNSNSCMLMDVSLPWPFMFLHRLGGGNLKPMDRAQRPPHMEGCVGKQPVVVSCFVYGVKCIAAGAVWCCLAAQAGRVVVFP